MEKKHSYKDVFTQTEYVKIMAAALINRFGDSIDAIASTWIVYQLTSSAAWSALIFGVNNLPTVVVTPLAGPWVEGRNKKQIMIVTDIIRAIVVAAVASLFLFNLLQPWMLLISTIIISTAEAFRRPADSALTPMVLSEELYEYGMSLHSSLSQAVQLVGVACAAGIIGFVGVTGALYIDMITFVLSAAIILFVKTNEAISEKVKFVFAEYLGDLKDGLKYVSKDAVIVVILLDSIFLNAVLVPINGLQAPMSEELLHGGVEILSIFSSAITLGMLLGSFVYPMFTNKIKNGSVLQIVSMGVALFYILLVVAEPLYKSKIFAFGIVAVLSFILGFLISFGNCMSSVLFMKKVDKEYIARASAILVAGCVAAMPVISFIVSAVVVFVSVKTIFLICGVLSVIVTLAFSRYTYLLDDEEVVKPESEESIVSIDETVKVNENAEA